jgi:hypothetical protein
MRVIQVILAGLLVLAVAALPALAAASSTEPETPSKTTKKAAAPGAATKARAKDKAAAPSGVEKVLPPLEPPPLTPPGTAKTPGPESPIPPSTPPGPESFPALPGKAPVAEKAGPPSLPPLPGKTPAPTVPGKSGLPKPPSAGEPGAPAAKVFPYAGSITGDSVYIRSGPGLYYYPVMSVNKDTRVTVEGEANGWLALDPPKDMVGLMRKGDVTVDSTGKAGTVAAASARVYAYGPSAKRQWCVMATLRQGDTVKVLGQAEGDMMRVAPPENARVYVVDQYVTAGAASSANDTAIARMEIEPPKVDPLVEEFHKAEADLRAELAKRVPDRKFDDVTARFKDIADKTEKTYIKKEALRMLGAIAEFRQQQADVLDATALGDKLDERLAEIKSERIAKEAEGTREKKEAARTDFLATGMVARMESLEDVDYPIKFKLVDQNNKPLVVLKSSTYDLNKYVGKVVGVRGTKTYLKDWRIYLISVDEIEALE